MLNLFKTNTSSFASMSFSPTTVYVKNKDYLILIN